jgi:ABC-type uncharacterized transport system, permease component
MIRRLAHKVLATSCLSALPFAAIAEAPNPFTSASSPAQAAAIPASNAIAALAPLLRGLTDRLVGLARDIERSPDPATIALLAAVSLAYGVFHSLGPGHGKTIVSSFFITKEAKPAHSLLAGALLALFHAVSATTIVLALYFIVRGVFSTGFESASRIVQIISFGLIAAIGAAMLAQRICGGAHRHLFSFGPRESKDLRDGGSLTRSRRNWRAGLEDASSEVSGREIAGIALAAGAVPCPGASAIILVCLSLNAMPVGILAVAMISIGMGLTVSAIGMLAILAKRGIIKATAAGSGRLAATARRIIEIAGAAILFLFGLAFFIAQF